MTSTSDHKILYIEDDSTLLSFVSETLADKGYHVTTCSDGRDGLDQFRRIEPDVVLLDLTLPGIGGLELLKRMKTEKPDIEIIIVSGTGREDDLVDCINEGAFRYYPKPFSELELLSGLKNAIELTRLRQTEKQHRLDLEKLVQQRTTQWQQSHNRFLALFHSLNLVFITDSSGRFVDANEAACNTLGYPHDELMGMRFDALFDQESSRSRFDCASSPIKDVLDKSESIELKLVGKEGQTIYLQIRATHIPDLHECIFISRNITKKVIKLQNLEKNKKELQTLNDRLVKLLQSTKQISDHNRLDQISQLFLEVFASNMGAEGGSIYQVDSDGLHLLHAIGRQKPTPRIEFPLHTNSIFGKAIRQKSPILVKDIDQEDQIRRSGGDYKNNSFLVLPVLNESKDIINLVSLHNKTYPPFTEQDRQIGQILASYTYESIRSAAMSDRLRRSEEMYRLLVENANEGIMVIQEIQPRFGNLKAEEITGYSLEDIKQMNLISMVHPEDRETALKIIANHSENQNTQKDIELRIFQKSGDSIWIECNSVHIEWEGKAASLILFNDISERKQAEKILKEEHEILEKRVAERTAEINRTNEILETEILIRKQAAKRLKQSEERFRSLVEISSDWIWELNKDGIYTYASPVVENLLGYKPSEVLGKTPIDLMSPELLPNRSKHEFKEVFERTIAGGEPFQYIEHQVKHKDGHAIILETSGVPLFTDAKEFIGFRGIDRNITERKRVEQERLRLIEILEATTDLVLITHPDSRILYMNQAGKRALGITDNRQLSDFKLDQLYPVTAFQTITNIGIPTAIKRGLWSAETIIKDKNDNEIPVSQVLMSHTTPSGELEYFSTIIRDMTERKQVEFELIAARKQAESANQAKSEFLSNISHELRTPMHHILSYSKFGMTKPNLTNAKILDYFTKINTSGSSLLELLNALLDLSKMEAGKSEYRMKENNMYHLVCDALEEFGQMLNEKEMTATVIQPDTNVLLSCDSYKIREVLRNLISNSIKFSEANKSITIRVEPISLPIGRRSTDLQTTPAIKVSIQDEGIGIPENELESIFDKFVQSSKTRTGAGGTGLGLSISKEIITAHNGKIWAENTSPSGTIFSFILPKHQPLAIVKRSNIEADIVDSNI